MKKRSKTGTKTKPAQRRAETVAAHAGRGTQLPPMPKVRVLVDAWRGGSPIGDDPPQPHGDANPPQPHTDTTGPQPHGDAPHQDATGRDPRERYVLEVEQLIAARERALVRAVEAQLSTVVQSIWRALEATHARLDAIGGARGARPRARATSAGKARSRKK